MAFRMLQDWSRINKAMDGLVAALNLPQNQQSGRGVDIPNHWGPCDCGCRILAAAAMKLVRKYPHRYQITRFSKALQFAKRHYAEMAMDQTAADVMRRYGMIAAPDDDIVGPQD